MQSGIPIQSIGSRWIRTQLTSFFQGQGADGEFETHRLIVKTDPPQLLDVEAALTLLPTIADLDVGTLYRRPGNAMRGLFLAILAGMCRKGMIEGFPVYILRMRRQV